jgi:hypothetical protein
MINFLDFFKPKNSADLTKAAHEIPGLRYLTKAQIKELNELLPWSCFTVDKQGNTFGSRASHVKRETPQTIPDKRILQLNDLINLKNKTVTEFGCFEGIHTIALSDLAKHVKAIDSRVLNVAKTMVRLGFYKKTAEVFLYDLENLGPENCSDLECDVLFHVGVFYHLSDPVKHLKTLPLFTKQAILLDTHYAKPESVNKSYSVDGQSYKYFKYAEHGYTEVFSGMKDHSKWLTLDAITDLLNAGGFNKITILSDKLQRNGPRVCLLAARNNL